MEVATQLQGALARGDAGAFVAGCGEALRARAAAFPELRQQIKMLVEQAHDAESVPVGDFVLSAVEEALANPDTTAICHLVLDTVADLPAWRPRTRPAHAADVLLRCAREQPRLAPKVAAAFHLDASAFPEGSPAQAALLDALTALLDSSATSGAAVALLLHFGPPVRSHFHVEAILEDLVLSSQDPVALRLVGELGARDMQELYVQYCLQYGQLRSANNAVKQFGLQQAFPDVERLHKSRQLEKMAGKGLWGVAATYVGEDAALRRRLLEAMLLAGELTLAEQHQELFGLQGAFIIHPEQLEVERAARRERFLQLPLRPEDLHYVDSPEGLEAMGAALAALAAPPRRHGAPHDSPPPSPRGAAPPRAASPAAPGSPKAAADAAAVVDRELERLPVLGLDLEWQPDAENSSPPSLLQLSTDTQVYCVDLLALAGQEGALAAALRPVLASDRVYKLGCGVASDCKKLADHHPAAFSLVRACLDLSALWRSHHIEKTGKRSTAGYKKRAGEISLSVLAKEVLGKPLDKTCQVSNWGQRPLTEQQLQYAALDAHAAVLVFRGMGQAHHPFATRQGLSHHTFTYDRRSGGVNGGKGGGGKGGGNGHGGGSNGQASRHGGHAHEHGHGAEHASNGHHGGASGASNHGHGVDNHSHHSSHHGGGSGGGSGGGGGGRTAAALAPLGSSAAACWRPCVPLKGGKRLPKASREPQLPPSRGLGRRSGGGSGGGICGSVRAAPLLRLAGMRWHLRLLRHVLCAL